MIAAVDIRPETASDAPAIAALAMAAFGAAEGPEIVGLLADLRVDPTAQPLLSLLAEVDGRVVGQVLFSRVRLVSAGPNPTAAILAPLAVHPDFQSQGIGGRLVVDGLSRLAAAGVELAFVLGHPGFYPRFGFTPAGLDRFVPPHPILPKNAPAWMLRELRPGASGGWRGQVLCAEAMADPKYWRE